MGHKPNLEALRKAPGIVRLHGHRAARGVLPENTLIAFRNTLEIGVQVVELDVLVTRDGVPVVTHNPRLLAASTRDADGNWLKSDSNLIFEMSFDELKKYDVGGLRAGTAYADRYPDQAFMNGQQVPSLADVAALVCEPQYSSVWLNIEIKSNPTEPGNTPPIPDLVRLVLADIRKFNISSRVIIQSFDWRVLQECFNQAPDLPRSFLSYAPKENSTMAVNVFEGSPWMGGKSLAKHAGSLPALIRSAGGQIWSPYFGDVDRDDITEAQNLGLLVNVWTVNKRSDMCRMIDLGVDGIITDYPARLQRCLLERSLSWRENIRPQSTTRDSMPMNGTGTKHSP